MLRNIFTALAGLAIGAAGASCASVDAYVQTNLVTDLSVNDPTIPGGPAAHQDANLVNPWGIVAGPTSPFWISDNGTGLSTLYNGSGVAFPPGSPLVVTIPGGAPTGVVFNSTSGFASSHFIFDTENGTVSGWSSGTAAVLKATAPAGSVYKGLALGSNASGNLLFAANFGLGRVDVYNSSFGVTSVSGGFKDASIPAGFAPFDIQNINGKLYVTYAKQDAAKHDDVAGPGNGFVDVFDMNGNLLTHLVSHGALNSPWGLALAPSGFGALSTDLLIGNFGDGVINAYDPITGAFKGTLDSPNGKPVVIDGLWGLSFGNGAFGQGLDSLYFTAGISGSGAKEDHGLFGSLTATPEPAPAASVGICGLAFVLWRFARRPRRRKTQELCPGSF